jgi:hypothetical protein
LRAVNVELQPEQPPEIEQAVAAVLEQPLAAPDPWWEAGNQEALET